MAPPVNRTWFDTLVDDDGSGTVGTVWNKAQVDGLLDSIDASLAGVVDKSGVPGSNALAIFVDADTLQGTAVRYSSSTFLQGTADGADTGKVAIAGGGAPGPTRGAMVEAFGNEFAGTPGTVHLAPGDAPAAAVALLTSAGLHALYVRGSDGLVQLPLGRLWFPATPNPSSDPNTLDDYREQVVAPIFVCSGGNSGQTYAINTATVTKIGRFAMATGRVVLSVKGTMSGAVSLRGLPFTTGAIWAPVGLVITNYLGFAAGVTWLGGYADPSQTDVKLHKSGAGAAVALDAADLTNASEISFVAIYTTSP